MQPLKTEGRTYEVERRAYHAARPGFRIAHGLEVRFGSLAGVPRPVRPCLPYLRKRNPEGLPTTSGFYFTFRTTLPRARPFSR